MKEHFDLQYWLHKYDAPTQEQEIKKPTVVQVSNRQVNEPAGNDLETVIARIESSHTDITSDYGNWCKIGFALVNEYGERGRGYFHRVSRFYPGYSATECDKQYDQCLKTSNIRTTMASFYYLAKEAGIDIDCCEHTNLPTVKKPIEKNKPVVANNEPVPLEEVAGAMVFDTPQLPVELYEALPLLLSESCALFNDGVEKDVFLIASLAVLSGCLPNIEGYYFEARYTAHLYAFITAPAGSGKGKMNWARMFGQAIHEHMTSQSRQEREAYLQEMQLYENLHKAQKATAEKPVEPPRRMFYIPGNSSSSAFIQALKDNQFNGVIFETEADSLSATFKQDWGNFSDVLRKAYHHEDTSMFRRKDNEHIEIKNPHLAIALSGTPNQVLTMMPDAENGLFSRFMYYAFEDDSEFKSPFVHVVQVDYNRYLAEKASLVFELYEQLNQLSQPLLFGFTPEQEERFMEVFSHMLRKSKVLIGSDFSANVKRLGLIAFRIAMVLTALRIIDHDIKRLTLSQPLNIKCNDQDFETAMRIATTLEKHAQAVFMKMPNHGLRGLILDFYERLPQQFDRQGYLKVAAEMGIKEKTAEKYIEKYKGKLLEHTYNQYTKIGSGGL